MIAALKKLLLVIPVMALLALVHTFILFVCAGFTDLQLVARGVNNTVALAASLAVAVGIHMFITKNHKIRDYIDGAQR